MEDHEDYPTTRLSAKNVGISRILSKLNTQQAYGHKKFYFRVFGVVLPLAWLGLG